MANQHWIVDCYETGEYFLKTDYTQGVPPSFRIVARGLTREQAATLVDEHNDRLARLEAVVKSADDLVEVALDIADCVLNHDQSAYEQRVITRGTAHILQDKADEYRTARARVGGEGA